MPTIPGEKKKLISYKIPPLLEKKIDASIEKGDFSSQADAITAALFFFYDSKEFEKTIDQKIEGKFKEFMNSDEFKIKIQESSKIVKKMN